MKKTDELKAQYSNFRTPFLLMCSERDTLVDTQAIKQFFRKSKSQDKKMILYNEGIHHFYIEKPAIRQEATRRTIQWILNRL